MGSTSTSVQFFDIWLFLLAIERSLAHTAGSTNQL